MRSLLTSFVPENHIALLFTVMAVSEGIAILSVAPLLGLSLSIGIEIGGSAVALPFFVLFGLYGFITAVLFHNKIIFGNN